MANINAEQIFFYKNIIINVGTLFLISNVHPVY